ncbi:MAG TPA: hypothetical protein VJ438_06185 [Candidatus Nanoarchaeia archaeon]|nr:hypothetical protein [Candidatus Nanoarchaeia archaeon]
MGNYEQTLQRRLTWAGLASLVSIPFTGPVGALGAIAIFSGKGLRFLKKDARKEYFSGGDNQEGLTPNSLIDKGPETAIAMQIPESARDLLENFSRERVYQSSLDRGYALAQHLVSLLPDGALDNSNGVRVTLERKTPGLFSSEEGYQLKIRIKR